jgi:hypothetical protein
MGHPDDRSGRAEDTTAAAHQLAVEVSIAKANLQEGKANGVGVKYDASKVPLAQGCLAYFAKALAEVADISAYGAKKYSVSYADQNWRRVDGASGRYLDALVRHIASHASGEAFDSESGKRHLAHAAWNALALLELIKKETT